MYTYCDFILLFIVEDVDGSNYMKRSTAALEAIIIARLGVRYELIDDSAETRGRGLREVANGLSLAFDSVINVVREERLIHFPQTEEAGRGFTISRNLFVGSSSELKLMVKEDDFIRNGKQIDVLLIS